MAKLRDNFFLVVTHVVFRNGKPGEGPYSSVIRSLVDKAKIIESIRLPLSRFNDPISYGEEKELKKLQVPKILGVFTPLKYFLDFVMTICLAIRFCLLHHNQESVVIGIDPLSTLPLIILKPFFGYKLVFYSVDFNEVRFKNPIMQKIYKLADKWSSQYANQIWVVSESLKKYKKKNYGLDSVYIPNSFPFDDSCYQKNKGKKTGSKTVWTGSVSTDKQIKDILKLSKELQKLRPEMEFWFIPSNKIEKFYQAIKEFNLKKARVFDVAGQKASRKLVSQCDLGIAVYDKDFGSTKFIEPIKIWEYTMCGVPFIISCEPSISTEIKKSGVVFFLQPDNKIPKGESLVRFIKPDNLKKLSEKCLSLAKKFNAAETIGGALGQF